MRFKKKLLTLKLLESRKNWKVIGYFNDQKASENTVEISLKKKDLVKIWMVRNFKMIYKNGKSKDEKKKKIVNLISTNHGAEKDFRHRRRLQIGHTVYGAIKHGGKE